MSGPPSCARTCARTSERGAALAGLGELGPPFAVAAVEDEDAVAGLQPQHVAQIVGLRGAAGNRRRLGQIGLDEQALRVEVVAGHGTELAFLPNGLASRTCRRQVSGQVVSSVSTLTLAHHLTTHHLTQCLFPAAASPPEASSEGLRGDEVPQRCRQPSPPRRVEDAPPARRRGPRSRFHGRSAAAFSAISALLRGQKKA